MRRARKLRRERSPPEVLPWQQLRKRPGGCKFRRQHPQSGEVLDFACMETRLAIEIDGEAHDRGNQPHYDVARDTRLAEAAYLTVRLPARAVLADLDAVVTAIVSLCTERGPHHRPSDGSPPRPGEDCKDMP